jgi:hypothetical protein
MKMTKEIDKTEKDNKLLISLLVDTVFELGKWVGQVELEEHFDKEQYGQGILESLYAEKMCRPLHGTITDNQVIVNIRSQKWRDGVRKTCNDRLQNIKKIFAEGII